LEISIKVDVNCVVNVNEQKFMITFSNEDYITQFINKLSFIFP